MLKNIVGLFVEVEDKHIQSSQNATATQPIAQQPHPVVGGQVFTPVADQVTADLRATLQRVIANRKTAYTALVEASDRLKNVIPDEITRIKAAYAMIAGDGQRTLADVIQAIDVHLADVEGELMRFKQSSESALTSKVGSLRASARNLLGNNESRQQRITTLEAEIATLRQGIVDDTNKANEITAQADATEAEINGVAAKFSAVQAEIKSDLANRKIQLSSVL